MELERKEVDDVLGGEEAWKDVEKTKIVCANAPDCTNDMAYFWSIQLRSSDEPETTFYKCTECGR